MGLFKFRQAGGSERGAHLPDNLRDDTQQSKVIIDSIDDGVVLIDSEHTIRLINPGAAAICGWSADDATDINVHTVIQLVNDKGEAISDEENPLKQIFSSDKSIRSSDLFLVTHDQKQVPVNLNLTPIMDHQKNVRAAVAILTDVTKERAAAKQSADFISTASHEMRTPVAAIEGYLALALNDKVATVDTRARGYLEKAHASAEHLGKLFQDLLTSAKAEDGRLISHPSVVEVGSFLEQLSSDLTLVAQKKGLDVEFQVGSNKTSTSVINATHEAQVQGGEKVIRPLYYVYADPDRLREVITNLFDNAVKYTEEGKIMIGLAGNDRVVQCSVRDTGPGIPPEDLPHLFQKFYRVDNSATRTIGGTGLGLFICRKIIELYNGRIWADSTLGEGSSFYINLPRLTTEKANKMLAENPAASATPADKPVNASGTA